MQVLSDTDHCFCVLLNANGGAVFPEENIEVDSYSCQGIDDDSDRSKISKVWVTSNLLAF